MRRVVTTAAVAAALVLGMAAPAGASAFYNRVSTGKPDPAKVHLSCGIFCASTFKIAPGGHASRPGKGGTFILTNKGSDLSGVDPSLCQAYGFSVADHGWATLEDPSKRYEWYVFKEGGSQVSGSPFRLPLTDCDLT